MRARHLVVDARPGPKALQPKVVDKAAPLQRPQRLVDAPPAARHAAHDDAEAVAPAATDKRSNCNHGRT